MDQDDLNQNHHGLNQEDDEIYVYCSASKEDAVKIRKRQVTAERLAIMFNVS